MKRQIVLILMLVLSACGSKNFSNSAGSLPAQASSLNSSAPEESDAACENGPAVNNQTPDMASPDSPLEITFSGTDVQDTGDGNLLYTFTLKNELAQASLFRARLGCISGSGIIATGWSFGQSQMRDPVTGDSLFASNSIISLNANESRTYRVQVMGVRPLDLNYNPCWILANTRMQQDGAKCAGTVR